MSDEYVEVEGRVFRRWRKDITKPRLKGKLSFEESLQMLINRCMNCPRDEFPENVYRLFWSMPEEYKDDKLYEEYGEAMEDVEYTQLQTCCGVQVLPEYMPPRVWVETETDWHKVFNAILNCCVRRNLLIPVERAEVVSEEE